MSWAHGLATADCSRPAVQADADNGDLSVLLCLRAACGDTTKGIRIHIADFLKVGLVMNIVAVIR